MKYIKIASVIGLLAVVFGAFGAHTLKDLLDAEHISSFETGVRYQFYHAFALLACGVLYLFKPSSKLNIAAASFVAGIILFSGSIYLLSTKSITGLGNISWLGPVTPLGGLFFILGWIFMFVYASEKQKQQ